MHPNGLRGEFKKSPLCCLVPNESTGRPGVQMMVGGVDPGNRELPRHGAPSVSQSASAGSWLGLKERS